MKKLLLTIVVMLPMVASAQKNYDFVVDGIYYKQGDPNLQEVSVVRKNDDLTSSCYAGNVVIPPTVTYGGKTYNVTLINGAFCDCEITSVSIPSSVTSIEGGSFWGCTNLTSITIPQSVTHIGPFAFCGCTSLSTVTFEGSFFCDTGDIYNIFDSSCPITTINVPDLNTWLNIKWNTGLQGVHLSYHLYINGVEVKDLVIPAGTKSIGRSAFQGCVGLTSVTIPESVETIGMGAFQYCDGLPSITIPSSVTSIGRWAFSDCNGLTSVIIPKNVSEIGTEAFQNCSGLTSITIEGSEFILGPSAFSDCNKLTDVYFTGLVDDGFAIARLGGWWDNPYTIPLDGTTPDDYSNITVHVPSVFHINYPTFFFENGISKYGFKDLKTLDGSGIAKCEKPVITFTNGKLSFSCATPGVDFHWTIKNSNSKDGSGVSSELYPSFTVSVVATKEGYVSSDMETRQFDCNTGALKGDVDGNGEVNVADHVELSNIILNQQGSE